MTLICSRPFTERLFRPTCQSQKTPGYCWRTYFKVLDVLFLACVSPAFLPSKKACGTDTFRHFGVRQQYVMRVPLATADEKGYAGGSTTARRRSEDSSAISLPTVGPGCSEAPPSVAPHRGSTQQRFCMKRGRCFTYVGPLRGLVQTHTD